MKPRKDPTKTDMYGMASDEQLRALLASDSIPDRLRARLMREANRRVAENVAARRGACTDCSPRTP